MCGKHTVPLPATMSKRHIITEKDVTFTEFRMQYNPETSDLDVFDTVTGESLSSYDAEFSCSCGESFTGFEQARKHAEETITPKN